MNIQEAKTHLSRLVEEVVRGETIIIGKAGKPLVLMSPYAAPVRNRKGGQLRGKIVESPGCWQTDELAEVSKEPLYPLPNPIPVKVAERGQP